MRNKSIFNEQEVKNLIENSDLTIQQIARKFQCRFTKIRSFIDSTYTKEYLDLRTFKMYSLSKSGDKSPMKGKVGELHHNYIGRVSDGNGYFMVLKPDWYTGRKGSKHVFEHSIVMCESLGLTEIPKGFHVHHVDGDKTNNSIDNLALLNSHAHAKIHSLEAQRLAEMRRELKILETEDILRNKYK